VNPKQFNPRLESMRGIAALIVAAYHASCVYQAGRVESVLWILNGDAAVTLFFILSGVVLGMGLQRAGNGSGREYAAYALRRIFRIYPAFLLATLVVLAFISLAHTFGSPQSWYNHALPYKATMLHGRSLPSGAEVRDNLLLVSFSLNHVTWTLGVEMFCSLFLPLAHYAKIRMPASGTWLILAASAFLMFVGPWMLLCGWRNLEGAFNWDYLGYFFLFYLGYLLPLLGPKLFTPPRTSCAGAAVLFAVSTVVLLSPAWCKDTHRFIAGVSAWVMLGILMYGPQLPMFRFFDLPIVRFYGRISYSFYLLHDLVLITLARLASHFIFDGETPGRPFVANVMLFVLSTAVATLFAAASYRLIERPSMEYGKRLARKVGEPSAGAVPVSAAMSG
jgi:peptidoglycan/LPS O-acetylase OafA/YrhL